VPRARPVLAQAGVDSPTRIQITCGKAFDLYYEFDYDLGVRDMEDLALLQKIRECNGKVSARSD